MLGGDGVVRWVEAARAAGQVVLHFQDGTVEAAVGQPGQALEPSGPAPLSSSSRSARKPRTPGDVQQDLFS